MIFSKKDLYNNCLYILIHGPNFIKESVEILFSNIGINNFKRLNFELENVLKCYCVKGKINYWTSS